MGQLLVYGAYGYTGQLVTERAVERGLEPVLGGRDPAALGSLARSFGLEHRVFDLAGRVTPHLEGVDTVLNVAGPFVHTATPVVEACLQSGTDYLDVTGEVPVFTALRGRNEAARDRGVTLLPGAGFDVVPSDCLGALLAREHPAGTELSVGLAGLGAGEYGGELSPGTARSALASGGRGSMVRRDGRLVRIPAGSRTRQIDFGDGETLAVAIPMGDIVTAGKSAGAADVTVYVPAPDWGPTALRVLDRLGPILDQGPVRRALEWGIDRTIDGPDEQTRAAEPGAVWGELCGDGTCVSGRVQTPNPYQFTADAAVRAAREVLTGDVESGFQTPATALGANFVSECDGTRVECPLGQ